MRNHRSIAGILLALAAGLAQAQTTQGLIAGKVFDSDTKQPLSLATVEYFRREQGTVVEAGSSSTNEQGFYTFAFLPPGTYQVRCRVIGNLPQTGDYQPQEIQQIELFVASRLEVNFALRKLTDVWRAGIRGGLYQNSTTAIIHFYAADVAQLRSAYLQLVPYRTSSLEATVSYVIDPKSVENLPLSGRDIYATLVLQPGVTADSATTRGLGLSANGQRPTSSNFLLDGVENNNYFLTGSLTPISPEAMQEYRVSVSSFSAEYGRTAGFLANAVTRAGGNGYHGLLFGYAGNDLLNANSFQANANGEPRVPDHELHAGYQIGGRILRNRLFFSSEFEQFRSRTFDVLADPAPTHAGSVCLPVYSRFLAADPNMSNLSTRLLRQFPLTNVMPQGTSCDGSGGLAEKYAWKPTVSINRSLGLERFDYVSPTGANRLTWRLILARASRPDFVASPYQGLDSRLSEDSTGVAIGYTRNLGPSTTNQLRLGWTNYDLHWNRPHSEIPVLGADAGVKLPDSELASRFAVRENDWELSDSISLVRGSDMIATGGGLLLRRPHSILTYYQDGFFDFYKIGGVCDTASISSILNFAADSPCFFDASVQFNYESGKPFVAPIPFVQPNFGRSYSNQQFNLFAQDTWRLTSRLSISAGLRYESFGTLKETGPQDLYVQAGPGTSPFAQLAAANTVFGPSMQRSLYNPDRNGWAPRLGVSYRLRGTILRAAYGMYYDRPFDNLLQNARMNGVSTYPAHPLPFQLLSPVGPATPVTILNTYQQQSHSVPHLPNQGAIWIDQNLRSPRIQSWFAGIQREISPNLTLEINHLGSSGRALLTSDQVNRVITGLINTRYNQDMTYIANQGASFYSALAAVLRYRTRTAQFQAAYTWSHSIDNQSDALRGGLDLGAATITGAGFSNNSAGCAQLNPEFLVPASLVCNRLQTYGPENYALFSRQFDWRADRGNSDFDQRHDLIFYSFWELPHLRNESWISKVSAGWQVAEVAGFRSGFPVNVAGAIPQFGGEGPITITNRPNLTGLPIMESAPVTGGLNLLNTNAFTAAPAVEGTVGGLGRNSIAGPRFWTVDLSVARSFPLFRSETKRLQVRADFFNAFNHANLNAPDGYMNSPTFGQALYGQSTKSTGFTAVTPLAAQQRQIQLQIKLFF